MAEDIAVVQSSHGNLGHDHLEEGREGREDTKLVLVEPKSSSSTEIAALHDTGWNEDFGVLLMDHLQTGGTLQVTLMTTL